MTTDLPHATGGDLATRAQESIWLAERDSPGSPAYNVHIALRLSGRLDLDALDRSLNAIVQRHDALRTRIVPGAADGALAEQHDQTPLAVRVIEVPAGPGGAREEQCARIAAREARTPFDPSAPLPVRAIILRLGDTDHVLLLTFHHTAADGWSLGIVAKELSALYAADRAAVPCSLPAAGSYRAYAARQRQPQPAWDRQLRYWAGRLAGSRRTELPSDRPRPGRRDLRGHTTFFELPRELSTALGQLSKQTGASLLMILIAGVTALIRAWTGDDDVTVGTRLVNRPREVQGIVGLFVNHVALRTSLADDPSGLELLGRVRQAAFEAYRHQEVPFERVLEELGVERDARLPPLFQVMVQHLKFGRAAVELPGIVVSPFGREGDAGSSDLVSACIQTGSTGSSRYELSFDFVETGDDIWARVDFSTQLFDSPTIDRLIAHLQALLGALAADPAARVSELRRRPGP